jgi:branched-chain amino acid aminotransferase
MLVKEEIIIRPIAQSRVGEVDFDSLEFGKYVSDHMLVCDYSDGEWQTPKIIPFGDITLSPTALALHYGQSVFEGMKAFFMNDRKINLFRPYKHYDRFTKSLQRLCMPEIPEELFVNGLRELIKLDKNWIPKQAGGALYIRPFVFASEARFGVKVSDEYRFITFTGPTGPMFAKPVKLKVETEFARASKGGTGYAKCSGNYGGAFYPTQKAKQAGFDQVLWTDAKEHKYIEESGMMNAMFVIDDVLITPPLSDSILDGITRDSLLTLAKDLDIKVEERPVSVAELELSFRNNSISEAFGAGTAAVVSPVEMIQINDIDHYLPSYTNDSIMYRLQRKLEAVRLGTDEDKHGWNFIF